MESDNLIISSIPEKGMMVSNGDLKHLKKYQVAVLNAGSSPLTLKMDAIMLQITLEIKGLSLNFSHRI